MITACESKLSLLSAKRFTVRVKVMIHEHSMIKGETDELKNQIFQSILLPNLEFLFAMNCFNTLSHQYLQFNQ